jgi:hypothetical protein
VGLRWVTGVSAGLLAVTVLSARTLRPASVITLDAPSPEVSVPCA